MTEGVFEANLLIENGRIKEFFKWGEEVDGAEIIDCSGKLILPGMIDAHVHFREPGEVYKEDWESGSMVAVSGGVTTVLDMPNNKPPILSAADLENKRALIDGRSYVNYGLYMGFDGRNLEEIFDAKGIAGVKIYMAHSTGKMGVFDGVRELLQEYEGMVVVHAEDEACIRKKSKEFLAEFDGLEADPAVHSKIRDKDCALAAVKKVCKMAADTGHKIHIAHVSTAEELEIISDYRGLVTCEVAPHHLIFCTDDYEEKGNFIKMNPPVRERDELFALWKALKAGDVDIISSDHAPHSLEEKGREYTNAPAGVPGVGYVLPLMLNAVNDEGFTVEEVVRLCCEKPAEIFGIAGKGKLEDGYDADIVVVDMDLEKKIERNDVKDKCGWSPYEGLTLKGWPVMTFLGGELVYKDGKIVGGMRGRECKF